MRPLPIEVRHDEDLIVVRAKMPDIDPGSLHVDVSRDTVTVEASTATGGVGFEYPIPFVADHEAASMHFAKGVLRIVLTPLERGHSKTGS